MAVERDEDKVVELNESEAHFGKLLVKSETGVEVKDGGNQSGIDS